MPFMLKIGNILLLMSELWVVTSHIVAVIGFRYPWLQWALSWMQAQKLTENNMLFVLYIVVLIVITRTLELEVSDKSPT